MKLTDNEKRDVIKYLEAGKSLPEKYRFLLFDDAQEVELLWNGKTNEVTNVVLPFQVIEQIDEPRSDEKFGNQGALFDTSGRQITGWTNKLIWGDNNLILSSLKNGPMRKEIEAQGGLKLIYIDPPFDVGADFSMDITIGDEEEGESFTKKPSVIEEIAYRDTWGKGADSFIAMIYERLKLMHDLLAEDGSIYVHCDWRLNAPVRLVMDEIFGQNNLINEIVWRRTQSHNMISKGYVRANDYLLFYSKSENFTFNEERLPYGENELKEYRKDDEGRLYKTENLTFSSRNPNRQFEWRGARPPSNRSWGYDRDKLEQLLSEGKILLGKDGNAIQRGLKVYLDDKKGNPVTTNWTDIYRVGNTSDERIDYPTQKSEALLERIVKVSSNEGDLVADFFCGSGTTLAVAEKLGRKWIGSDLGKFGIHTTRKRMIGVQRELKKASKDFRAFEILNVGRYERESFLSTNDDLRAEEKAKQAERKEREFAQLILAAYKAEPVQTFETMIGKKRDRLVAVGPINAPVSERFVLAIIKECGEKNITKVDVLGFDWEMGFDRHEFGKSGIDITFKVIPREVFDKRAVEKGQVNFYDVAFIEAEAVVKGRGNTKELSIALTDFSVFYNQDNPEETALGLRPGGAKIVVENGQVVKIAKDKKSEEVTREILTKKWSDWIDYWAVDYNFADRKEIVKVLEDGVEKEVWTGDYIFDNEWQSFRTKKSRNLELVSAPKEVMKGTYKVAVKVVDIFGNDTTKVIEVNV